MELTIGVSRGFKETQRFQEFPTSFPDTNTLNKSENKVLKILEIRSLSNNGDTKIYNKRLAKITSLSVRTVERIVHKLEKSKYISRLIKRRFDYRRISQQQKDGFYCLRIIRCNRILLASRFKIYTQKELGWKQDIRPNSDKSEIKPPISWMITHDQQTKDGVVIKPEWGNYFDLVEKGIFDISIFDTVRKLKDLVYCGDENAINILGYTNKEW